MKVLGSLMYFLGLEITTGSHGIFLSQHKYAQDLVAAAGLQDSTPLDTPMELNLKLHKEVGDLLLDHVAYRTLVGSLVYLTITRHDISYVVQQLYGDKIIRYVHGTTLRGLFYPAALISWKSKKHDCVSMSSTKFEYKAMSQACAEIHWL
ncbi:uncharacterized mitochondrial protein AtMg00810-like [Malania oleifera]|uniref:uncharacterized mitochondrial protein AtMg00810-like n=1 Tax=Malania oleifera TaxID=397392 RepID=UPI0025AE4233|nr:uncharacterized mitochondrial protein AtMg00810-like [Malania oleifera]